MVLSVRSFLRIQVFHKIFAIVSHYRKMSKVFTQNIASDSVNFILAGVLAIAM